MKKLVVLTLILFVNLSFSQDLKFGKEVFQAKFNIDAITLKKNGATLNASGDASDYVEGNYNTVYLTYEMTNNLNLDGRGEFTGYVWAQNGENFMNVTLQGIWRRKGQVFEIVTLDQATDGNTIIARGILNFAAKTLNFDASVLE
tara:strand:- start:3048 stop:3482 length:435 start_codon:yes stop_codon:yes gene_type:complete